MEKLNTTFTKDSYFYILNFTEPKYPVLVVYDMRNGQPLVIKYWYHY